MNHSWLHGFIASPFDVRSDARLGADRGSVNDAIHVNWQK
jgi:hypothetical protein